MKVLAIGLPDEVSLLLVQEANSWRFSSWSRAADGFPLPAPPDASLARAFASPDDAAAHFQALCATDPTARMRMGLERERDALRAGLAEGGVSPQDRWEEAQRRAK